MRKLTALFTLSLALSMQAQQHVMTVDVSKPTAKIQPEMYGIFFEDINFGADGGLYAELVKNRSFEFPQPFVGWVPFGNVTVQDANPCFDYVVYRNAGFFYHFQCSNVRYSFGAAATQYYSHFLTVLCSERTGRKQYYN